MASSSKDRSDDPLDQFFDTLPAHLRSVVTLSLNLASTEGESGKLSPRQKSERIKARLMKMAPKPKEDKP